MQSFPKPTSALRIRKCACRSAQGRSKSYVLIAQQRRRKCGRCECMRRMSGSWGFTIGTFLSRTVCQVEPCSHPIKRYSASLALHRSLFSLHESKLLAENELALTYNIDRAEGSQRPPCLVTLTLLFHPNTRRLADASISSPDPVVSQMDFADLVGSHVQSNDVLGLVRGIMARIRSS